MRAQLRAELPHRDTRSAALCEQIRRLPAWAGARTVGLFAPLPEEPDLLALLEHHDKRFVFPSIQGTTLHWRVATHAEQLLPVEAMGSRVLREPTAGEPVDLGAIELLLVPGLAFTTEGVRLGRGGGYYDRVLASLPRHTLSVGICHAFQVLGSLPTEAHDLPVACVLYA